MVLHFNFNSQWIIKGNCGNVDMQMYMADKTDVGFTPWLSSWVCIVCLIVGVPGSPAALEASSLLGQVTLMSDTMVV